MRLAKSSRKKSHRLLDELAEYTRAISRGIKRVRDLEGDQRDRNYQRWKAQADRRFAQLDR